MQKRKIKSYMALHGINMSELAKSMGLCTKTLSSKINGHHSFSITEVKKLCDLLSITDANEIRDIFFN